ncbi:MAG TPA: hypothetical protein VK424_07800 [Thermoplasmata archaeon]|nr:hypothetical protein [Thermoplasmata archaeon]
MAGFRWGAKGGPIRPPRVGPLVLALLMVPTGLGSTTVGGAVGHAVPGMSADLVPSPSLTVSPASSWVADGNSTPLEATWSPGGTACTVLPSWFHWFVNSPNVGGTLIPQNASGTNFTGAASQTGSTEVGVRSAATVTCGNSTLGVFRTAYATVTTIALLVLDDVSAGPLLLPDSGSLTLTALVEGGVPPYRVEVRWGDGNLSLVPLAQGGAVEVDHPYSTGVYLPEVTVADSSGLEANGTVPESVRVGSAAAFAISASLPVAEVGHPVRFTSLANPPAGNDRVGIFACGDRAFGPAASSVNITCDPSVAGNLPVLLEVLEAGGTQASSSILLDDPVVPALDASVVPLRGEGEVDQGSTFALRISGGAPPFEVAGSFEGIPLPTENGIPGDGTILLVVTPAAAGLLSLSLLVTDADGVAALGAAATLLVQPSLLVSLSTGTVPQGSVARVTVVTTTTGGEGPVGWVVLTTPPSVSSDPPTGGSLPDSSFEWAGSFASEGTGTVRLIAVDAAGNLVVSQAVVTFVIPITGQFSVVAIDPPGGAALNLTLDLTGGAPPFAIWVNVTGDGGWNATDPSDGVFYAEIPTRGSGPVSVALVVVDALGGRIVARTSVITDGSVVVGPAAPPPTDPSSLLGAGLGVALLAVGVGLYVRRRRRSVRPAPAAPDPVKVLEGILTPADGAERVTVELLAEEAGVPLDTVRSTLTHLIAAGRVRSEVSPEGMEVLAWSTSSPP